MLDPRAADPVKTEREHIVVLSDFSEEDPNEILRNLKNDHSYYNRGRRTVGEAIRTALLTGGLMIRTSNGNAIQNPLLDEVSLKGAKAVLVNVTGGLDMTLLEVDEAANAISAEVDADATNPKGFGEPRWVVDLHAEQRPASRPQARPRAPPRPCPAGRS